MVERKTLYTIIRKVESKSPREIAQKTIEEMRRVGLKCLSITNDNGLIRRFFPRHTSMKDFSNEAAKQIQESLNSRPRKKLPESKVLLICGDGRRTE